MNDSVIRRFKLDPTNPPKEKKWSEPGTAAIAWTDKNGDTWVEIRESEQGPLRPPEERHRKGDAA